jgi:hypothetical protein
MGENRSVVVNYLSNAATWKYYYIRLESTFL